MPGRPRFTSAMSRLNHALEHGGYLIDDFIDDLLSECSAVCVSRGVVTEEDAAAYRAWLDEREAEAAKKSKGGAE